MKLMRSIISAIASAKKDVQEVMVKVTCEWLCVMKGRVHSMDI
jgi:hypothetical protein